MRKKARFNIPKAKRLLDRRFREYIKHTRELKCAICGASGVKLDLAHIIPRSILFLRWNSENVLLLDVRCHKWSDKAFHQNPLYFSKWYNSNYNNTEELLQKSETSFVFDETFFKEKLKELQYSVEN